MRELILALINLVSYLTVLAGGLALLAFMWGLAKFIFRAGQGEKAQEEGKRIMTWGLVALFVMTSVWGIVRFIQRDLGLPQESVLLPGGGVGNLRPGISTPLDKPFDPPKDVPNKNRL